MVGLLLPLNEALGASADGRAVATVVASLRLRIENSKLRVSGARNQAFLLFSPQGAQLAKLDSNGERLLKAQPKGILTVVY